MKNKKVLLGLIALVLAVCLMGWLWLGSRQQVSEGTKQITVTVVHADSTQREIIYSTTAEYLGQLLLDEGLVAGEQGPYGLMISAVDGETADWDRDHSYWAFYIDGEYASTGVDTTPVQDGTAYQLVYTIG